ncbi:MAG: hypothetical protein ACLFRS_02680 [Halomonas sp.]
MAGVLMALLAGCGGEDEPHGEDNGDAAAREETSRDEAPAVPPMEEEVAIEIEASLGERRLLEVNGESNLPDEARLKVVVERELSGVRWRERVSLGEGRFEAGPFGPGSGLPDGGYRVTVSLSEASVQPESVKARIGDKGEHLSGPLVTSSRHGLGQVASASRRFLVGSEPRRASDRAEVLEVE